MRMLACLFVLTVVVVVSAKPVRPAKPDQNRLQGDWTVASAVKDGDDPQEGLDKWTYTFKENDLLIHAKLPDASTLDEKATFSLDSTKKAQADRHRAEGSERRQGGVRGLQGRLRTERQHSPHLQGDSWLRLGRPNSPPSSAS